MATPAYYLTPDPPPQVTLPAGTDWARLISPPPAEVDLWVYREALARMARAAYAAYSVPSIVRSGWHLRLKIGETMTLMRNGPAQSPRKREGEGDIRGLMLNFERIMQPEPEADTMGKHELTSFLSVTAWIIHGYSKQTGAVSAQADVEREARLLMWMVKLNLDLGLTGNARQQLRNVTPLNFPTIDLHGFSEGTECFIAQGSMQLTVTEQDTRPEPA